MKKGTVTGIIGAVSGLVTIKTVHNFFKANQGKVGPIGMASRILTEAALGATAAGLSMTFADKCADVGKEIYNEILKRMGGEDGEDGEYSKYNDGGMPIASQFVSKIDYYHLISNALVDAQDLYYYTEDSTLTCDDGTIVDDDDLIEKIKEQLKDDRDEWNGSDGTLFYFKRYGEYSYYKIATVYEISILYASSDKVKIKEEEDGGESERG